MAIMSDSTKIRVAIKPQQIIAYYLIRFVFYFIITMIGGILMAMSFRKMVLVYTILILYFVIFNRGDRIISDIDINDHQIKLTYWKLFAKRSIIIPKNHLSIKKVVNNKSYSIRFYDDRFITNPVFMDIVYSKNILIATCSSKESIQEIAETIVQNGYIVVNSDS